MKMVKNSLGRLVPAEAGSRILRPYAGLYNTVNEGRKAARWQRFTDPRQSKVIQGIDAAIEATGLSDGMTISFHHLFRNGDKLVNQVLEACARRGIKGLRLFATALFPCHEPVVEYIQNGTIDRLEGSMNGPVGAFVSQGGKLRYPAILRSHGGRWRAVEAGDVEIDVAFVAASQADHLGNANGVYGKTPCGTLTYSAVDAQYARKTVVVTNELVPFPAIPLEIQMGWVDYVCLIDEIGDPNEITGGTLELTRSPSRLKIAHLAAQCVRHSPYFKDGLSFQGGAGSISLAATKMIGDEMKKSGITAGFIMGGVTKLLVEQLRQGLTKTVLHGQSFDLDAIRSLAIDPGHVQIDVGFYANYDGSCATYGLDAAFLGATEVDLDFNVNVNTHSDGLLLHGIGGHQDVAHGSRMCIITTPTLRGRMPVILDRVTTVTTPGEAVDVIVTERGIAVNPRRMDLQESFRKAGLPVKSLEEMKAASDRHITPVRRPIFDDEVIGIIEWADGTVIDCVRRVQGWE